MAYLGFLISKEKEDRESLQLEEAKKLQRKSDFREYIEYCADTTNELKRVAGFTGLFSILNESKEENYLYQIMEVVRSYLTTSRSGDQLVEKKIFSELDELLSYRPTSSTIESLEDRIDSIDSTISKLEKFSTTHLKILSLLFNSLIYVLNKIKNLMIPLKEILEERKIKNDPYFALNNYTTLDLSGITVSIPLKMELKYGKIDFSRSTFLENVKLSRSSKTYSIRSIIDEETIIINDSKFSKNLTLIYETRNHYPVHYEHLVVDGICILSTSKDKLWFENSQIKVFRVLPRDKTVKYKIVENSDISFSVPLSQIDGFSNRQIEDEYPPGKIVSIEAYQ
ncbi:hypothetical protein [Rothia amarae]|uniref:hypothetical protein n=1 Tax=Rothia amarae TaxID=169480 RepID=UPI0012462B22